LVGSSWSKNSAGACEPDPEQALIDKLQEFLLELGRGFCFAARQKLMRYEDKEDPRNFFIRFAVIE